MFECTYRSYLLVISKFELKTFLDRAFSQCVVMGPGDTFDGCVLFQGVDIMSVVLLSNHVRGVAQLLEFLWQGGGLQ